ncbi:MAG: PCMD domain-containing protein [Muribaculaceae bacterium]|nr:PCMD domain-containing protein [Muribaculaceae bacterium]
MKKINALIIAAAILPSMRAEKVEPIRFGNFDSWVTREISESAVIGGNDKTIYEIGPTQTIKGNKPYSPLGGSPWATSNVYAKVMGVVKGSNAVFPDERPGHGKCAKLTTLLEHCKAIGLVNIDVTVAGSIFLGRMFEPIKSTSNPYSKMEMGIPFTKRPKALSFDYKLVIPTGNERLYSSGFSKKKTLPGHENAEVYILLQRRWEDEDGNLHARRVGTGCEVFKNSSNGWVNSHRIPVIYGEDGAKAMSLITKENSHYARNSKGKMVPVIEEGWDAPDATPTHLLVMASAAEGEPFVGTIGMTMWVDNMALVY